MILMHVSGVGQQFEQRLVELLVIEFVDKSRVRLSDRIIKGALPFRRFVDRNERRTNSRSFRTSGSWASASSVIKLLKSRKGTLALPTVIISPLNRDGRR